MTRGRSSAYSVIQAWNVSGGACYLVNQFREQADFADLRENLRRFRKAYRPVAILIERAARPRPCYTGARIFFRFPLSFLANELLNP
jgi:hypothetical protein